MKNLLPSMEYEFEINVKGDDTGHQFQGKFKYKRLNIQERISASKMETRLNESLEVQVEVALLHEKLSWLRYGLVEYPDWWKESDMGMTLYDVNVIVEVYDKISKFEEEWKNKLVKGPKKKND